MDNCALRLAVQLHHEVSIAASMRCATAGGADVEKPSASGQPVAGVSGGGERRQPVAVGGTALQVRPMHCEHTIHPETLPRSALRLPASGWAAALAVRGTVAPDQLDIDLHISRHDCSIAVQVEIPCCSCMKFHAGLRWRAGG